MNNGFLRGDLHEEVYIVLPFGFQTSQPNQVCKLQKSLYGLKQASRQWFVKLSTALLSLGYIQSSSDHSLFIKNVTSNITIILVYVDDIILAGTSKLEITSVKSFLNDQFKIKDLEDLQFFLGLEVSKTSIGITLNQRKYALDILSDTGYLEAKLDATPMDSKAKLSKDIGDALFDPQQYRRLIGRLLY